MINGFVRFDCLFYEVVPTLEKEPNFRDLLFFCYRNIIPIIIIKYYLSDDENLLSRFPC